MIFSFRFEFYFKFDESSDEGFDTISGSNEKLIYNGVVSKFCMGS